MGPGPSFLSRIINYAMGSVGILSGTATLEVGNKDEILDMIRDDIYGVVPLISSNYAVAQQHGAALLA